MEQRAERSLARKIDDTATAYCSKRFFLKVFYNVLSRLVVTRARGPRRVTRSGLLAYRGDTR